MVVEPLHDLIAKNESWLMQRVLEYARLHGYTAYTSTLVEAWRASIAGISAPLVAALRAGEPLRPLNADCDFTADPVALFGIDEAKKHRERGVTFPLFLGLMKYYRKAYVDLLLQAGYSSEDAEQYRERLDNFFDRIELGFSAEWMKINQVDLIQELQQANLEITNERNKFLTIFESLPNPVLLLNRNNSVINLNRAAASLFYGAGLPGTHYYSGTEQPLPPVFSVEVTGFFESGDISMRFEKEIATACGARQYIVLMQRMLDVSGKFLGIVIILNDITPLKELEGEIEMLNTDLADRAFQLERANQELETFNYSVSHDLRSPLTGISGYCQLMLGQYGDRFDAQSKGFIAEIIKTCSRMNQFITVMLDFSRLARCEVKREPVNLTLMAESIAGSMRLENPERRVDIGIADSLTAQGDPRLLRVVMENLLGNAWKYTAKKDVAKIEVGAAEMAGERVFFVRDNGVGFEMSQAGQLFAPFKRLHHVEDFSGFGVGLASVERIITRHGGRVWAEGAPEQGATIYFTLPAGD